VLIKLYDFWTIVEDITFDFINTLEKIHVHTLKRDFSNLFFVYFIRELSKIIEEDKETKIVFCDIEYHNEISKHFGVEESHAFYLRFYNKMKGLFPMMFVDLGDPLHGTFLLEDLDYGVVERILQLKKCNTCFEKLKKEFQKRFKRIETLKIQNFSGL
jgi:hypothetical protein